MKKFFFGWVLPFVLAGMISLLLYLGVRKNILTVVSDSMKPVVSKGQKIVVRNAEKIQRGDILLIVNPLNDKIRSMKRCAALPGDTVEICSKKLFVNGILQDESFARSENGFPLPDKVYPFSRYFYWNSDFYGPLVVPKKGLSVNFGVQNFVLYRFALEKFENVKTEYKNGKFFVDGKQTEIYTFKNDYFFVLNDFRDDVSDSRTFGFVPQKSVEGKFYATLFD